MAEATAAPGFERDIAPLFRPVDVDHMAVHGVLLDQYTYMSDPDNSEKVYGSVANGSMPPGDAWTAEKVQLLRAWIDAGRLP